MVGPGLFELIKAGPFALVWRAFHKTFIGPFIYVRDGKFDARRFWIDRYRKYGTGLKSSGFEGLGDAENLKLKAEAAAAVLDVCAREGIDPAASPILDIGVAAGYVTRHLQAAGVSDYTGVDIVDTLFPDLRSAFPDCRFIKADITAEPIPGRYRMAFMLDVIQSIVDPEGLRAAMANVRGCLEDGGVFIIAPLFEAPRKVHFYTRLWSRDEVLAHFPGYTVREPISFRDQLMYVLKKPAAPAPTSGSPP